MSCIQGISEDLINDCDANPVAGLEQIAYVIDRSALTATKDGTNKNLVTALAQAVGAQAYKIQGYNKSNNAGSDLVVADAQPNRYTQYFSMIIWQVDSDTVQALNDIDDVVVIVENKNKGKDGDGAFEMYGYDTGLYKSSFTKRSNDNGGGYSIEMTSREGEAPTRSHYVVFDTDYDTTKTMIEALLVTGT